MFPYSLQKALMYESDKKNNQHSHSDDDSHSDHSNQENDKPRASGKNWFHSYQIPAEAPIEKPVKQSQRKRSKSLGAIPSITNIPIYEPMNPEKKMEWNKLIPHPHKKYNWFHCYQIPNEKPIAQPKES